MSTWAPPEADLEAPGSAAPTWKPPEVDDIASPEGGAGTRVENPGLESFGAGAVEGLGAASGMWAGARLGSMTGSPWGVAAGMVGGAVLGSEAGQGARELMGLRTPQQMAPDQRAFGEFSYSLGAGTAAAATPFGAAAVGLRLLEAGPGKWLANVMRQVQRNPKTFAAIEGAGVLSAAAGAGVAEVLDPGDPLTRTLGEIGGAIVRNRALVSSSLPMLTHTSV